MLTISVDPANHGDWLFIDHVYQLSTTRTNAYFIRSPSTKTAKCGWTNACNYYALECINFSDSTIIALFSKVHVRLKETFLDALLGFSVCHLQKALVSCTKSSDCWNTPYACLDACNACPYSLNLLHLVSVAYSSIEGNQNKCSLCTHIMLKPWFGIKEFLATYSNTTIVLV